MGRVKNLSRARQEPATSSDFRAAVQPIVTGTFPLGRNAVPSALITHTDKQVLPLCLLKPGHSYQEAVVALLRSCREDSFPRFLSPLTSKFPRATSSFVPPSCPTSKSHHRFHGHAEGVPKEPQRPFYSTRDFDRYSLQTSLQVLAPDWSKRCLCLPS